MFKARMTLIPTTTVESWAPASAAGIAECVLLSHLERKAKNSQQEEFLLWTQEKQLLALASSLKRNEKQILALKS